MYLRFELSLEDVSGELVGELLLAELDRKRDDLDHSDTRDLVAVEKHVSAGGSLSDCTIDSHNCSLLRISSESERCVNRAAEEGVHDKCVGDQSPDGRRGRVGDPAIAHTERLERPVRCGQRVAQVFTADVSEPDVSHVQCTEFN